MPTARRVTLGVWMLALAGLPFQRPTLVLFGLDLAPAELAAAPLLGLAACRARRAIPSLTDADRAGLAWTAAVLVGAALVALRAPTAAPWLREGVVSSYLLALFAAVRATAEPELRRQLPCLLALSAGLAALLGLVGVTLELGGTTTPLALTIEYPYVGSVPKAMGLSAGPNMLASLMITALLLLPADGSLGRPARRALGVLLALGLIAAVSKTAVCLAAGLLVAARMRQPAPGVRRRVWPAPAALAVLYLAASHVVVAPARETGHGPLVAADPLAEWRVGGTPWQLLPTNYWHNKRVSLRAIAETFPFGLGPGGQHGYAARLAAAGQSPRGFWHGGPHSTPLGAVAELGLAGLLGLALFAFWCARALTALPRDEPLRPALFGLAAAVMVESLATDVMHFRHYVWVLGVLSATLAHARAGPQPQRGTPAGGPIQ